MVPGIRSGNAVPADGALHTGYSHRAQKDWWQALGRGLVGCLVGAALFTACDAKQPEPPTASALSAQAPLTLASAATLALPAETSQPTAIAASDLRLNHIQMEGTHNSTHIQMPGPTLAEYHYGMDPLDVQFEEQGVRKVELDLHYNAQKDRIAVYHLFAIDFRSTCRMLLDCLQTIKTWSDANPLHHPIVIQFELKEFSSPRPPEYFLNQIETDIRAVFPMNRIVTPDMVKGGYSDLASAVKNGNWPRIDDVRGRVMFAMESSDEFRIAYTSGDLNLDGKLIFVDAPPGYPYSAYVILNDPVGDLDQIRAALAAGLIVRTRAGSCCSDDESVYYAELDAALASGANIISTDFPEPYRDGTFFVEMPGGTPSRCNPITAPAGCTSEAIENLP